MPNGFEAFELRDSRKILSSQKIFIVLLKHIKDIPRTTHCLGLEEKINVKEVRVETQERDLNISLHSSWQTWDFSVISLQLWLYL